MSLHCFSWRGELNLKSEIVLRETYVLPKVVCVFPKKLSSKVNLLRFLTNFVCHLGSQKKEIPFWQMHRESQKGHFWWKFCLQNTSIVFEYKLWQLFIFSLFWLQFTSSAREVQWQSFVDRYSITEWIYFVIYFQFVTNIYTYSLAKTCFYICRNTCFCFSPLWNSVICNLASYCSSCWWERNSSKPKQYKLGLKSFPFECHWKKCVWQNPNTICECKIWHFASFAPFQL